MTPEVSARTAGLPPELAVLAPFVEAGVFSPYEVHVAAAVARLQPGVTDEVLLALAVAARAPRFGHVCTRLEDVAIQLAEPDGDEAGPLPWPTPATWSEALVASDVVVGPDLASVEPVRPLVWDANRLYLQRYWHYELLVADDLERRVASASIGSPVDPEPSAASIDALFGPDAGAEPDLQRQAALRGLRPGVSIIAGGPGTGKTYTVARLLAAAHRDAADRGRQLRVALAAPTGKAAARLGEAVKEAVLVLEADSVIDAELAEALVRTVPTTVHALLGWRSRTRFLHDRADPLPHDLVIVDETSMVSLPLMAKMLDAVRPEARLVLVGDPFQLASIEAGTVMRDLVGPTTELGGSTPSSGTPLAGRVTVLERMHRFGESSSIAALADAVRHGNADTALSLLGDGRDDLVWVAPGDTDGVEAVTAEVVEAGAEVVAAAQRGDALAALAAAGRIKVLTGTRRGPWGLDDWTERIEGGIGRQLGGFGSRRRWHVGRPVLVTANDRANQVFNGDTGVVVNGVEGLVVALADGQGVRMLAPSRLDQVETWWAMTIHKAQGSEFAHAVVSLPDRRSPILTRELLYTAVTRARHQLTVVASEEALRMAVNRPLVRASGLQERLWPAGARDDRPHSGYRALLSVGLWTSSPQPSTPQPPSGPRR